jgi:AcrR family transcriptional regulator
VAIPYLETTDAQEDEVLKRLFDAAVAENFPVVFKLDGLSWWENRPDLWNHWDPANPGGYSPSNVDNVEWTGWTPDTAIEVSWRDWGSVIRIAPHPNLASPKVLAEKQQSVTRLVRKIAAFYRGLSRRDRALVAGVVLDNELSIGVNAFHYQNGNSYLGKPDPPPGTPTVPLGHAAVKGYGLAQSGSLTPALLNAAVKKHASWLAKVAHDAATLEGVDLSEKTFVHGFADQASATAFDFGNVVTPWASPGWSFYGHAYDPLKASGASSAIAPGGGNVLPWGAVEWLYIGGLGGDEYTQWANALRNTLSAPNSRIVTVQNWESINGDHAAGPQPHEDAVANVALESPACLLEAPAVEAPQVAGGVATIRWYAGAGTGAMFFNASSSGDQVDGGGFAKVDVANDDVTGKSEKVLGPLGSGTYWVKLIADGCTPTQRAMTTVSFTVPLGVAPEQRKQVKRASWAWSGRASTPPCLSIHFNVSLSNMNTTRGYSMTARADSAAETGRRIVAAARALFLSLDYEDVTLKAIADRAGVTLQTVIRRYASKEGLVNAVADEWGPEIMRSRAVTRPADLDEAVHLLVTSYEEMGAMNWRMLRQEHRMPVLHERLVKARAFHKAWVEETFAPLLPRRGRARELRVLQLFAATDLYAWKLLRIDLGLPIADVERLIRDTVAAITAEKRP